MTAFDQRLNNSFPLVPGCFGKAGFVDKVAALAMIRRRMDRHRRLANGAKALGPYRCRECRQWHIRGERR